MGREGAKGAWEAVASEDASVNTFEGAEDSDKSKLITPQQSEPAQKKLLDYDEVEEDAREYADEDEDEDIPLCENFLHYVLPNLFRRWKSIVAATILLLLGIVFLGVSIFSFTQGWWGYASSLLVLALICGLPGAFVFFVVYKVIRMDPNYDLDIVPDYNMTV